MCTNSSVAHLAYFAAYFELHSKIDGRWLDECLGESLDEESDPAYAAASAIGRHFTEVDPAACRPPQDGFWAGVVEDGFASGLYSEWSWDRASVRYFLARGIDPTVLQPRRPLPKRIPNPWAGPSGPGA